MLFSEDYSSTIETEPKSRVNSFIEKHFGQGARPSNNSLLQNKPPSYTNQFQSPSYSNKQVTNMNPSELAFRQLYNPNAANFSAFPTSKTEFFSNDAYLSAKYRKTKLW